MLARLGAVNLGLIVAISVALTIAFFQREPSRGLEIVRGTPAAGVDQAVVHVSGAVVSPGVIEAEPGDRVADVIERAGGFTSEADRAALNLTRRVRDEDVLHVPAIGEATPLVNLNEATAKELEALPGIGPVYASRIVEARTVLPFASSDELLERELIPERTYEQIRDLVSTTTP